MSEIHDTISAICDTVAELSPYFDRLHDLTQSCAGPLEGITDAEQGYVFDWIADADNSAQDIVNYLENLRTFLLDRR